MKISQRLAALSGFSAAGLLCVAGVSFFAVTSIQSDLRALTNEATPLQTKTYELQERTERLLGTLLKLTLARTRAEVDKAGQSIRADTAAIDKLKADIQAIDPNAKNDAVNFRAAQDEIVRVVEKRLSDEEAYRSESENARLALQKAQQAVGVTRNNVDEIGVEAGKAADKAQDASHRQANVIKLALSAQARLKEIAIVVSETDTVTNRFRLTPLKEKAKAAVDSILRLEAEKGADDVLKEVKAVVANTYDAFANETTGLVAARAAVLAKKDDAESQYQAKRRALLAPLDEQASKLGMIIDASEVQAVKQRQVLESALKLRNEPGGVVGISEEVSLGIREMVAALRLLMLAGTPEEAGNAGTELNRLGTKLTANMNSMRAGLIKMGRPQLAANVDGALAAMASVNGSVNKVVAAKKSLLTSEAQMAASLAQLKAVASQQASAGEKQVKTIAERQAEVSAAVDRRVNSALFIIVAISGAIIVVSTLLSFRTVRIVTQSLDQAVHVAEAVSAGHLEPVPPAKTNDETARLLAALGSMVNTLTKVVTDIRNASESINAGSHEISLGNQDL
ncbi:MAG TPA: methyl-accepting chemotaxis protein, partial [Burkholderiaceae bacterium]|nr:methyl-accepting chemotaxis protein [Burkholderiaceae bacterium]